MIDPKLKITLKLLNPSHFPHRVIYIFIALLMFKRSFKDSHTSIDRQSFAIGNEIMLKHFHVEHLYGFYRKQSCCDKISKVIEVKASLEI